MEQRGTTTQPPHDIYCSNPQRASYRACTKRSFRNLKDPQRWGIGSVLKALLLNQKAVSHSRQLIPLPKMVTTSAFCLVKRCKT